MAKTKYPTKRYRFECKCGKDPLHGTIASSPAAEEQVLSMLGASFAVAHSRPGCELKASTIGPYNKKAPSP